MNISNVKKKNDAYADDIVKFITAAPKVVAYEAALSALESAMEPDGMNYAYGQITSSGSKKTPHGSSNAAWNWRISTSGSLQPGLDHRGRGAGSVVGERYDKRSSEGQEAAMAKVIDERVEIDIYEKLKTHLFNKKSSVTGFNFVLYNNLDSLPNSDQYVEHANLVRVRDKAETMAASGGILGEQQVSAHFTSPKPNLTGLLGSLE